MSPYLIPDSTAHLCDGCEGIAGADPDNWVEVASSPGAKAFVTDRQRSDGAILVLPKRHAAKLSDLSPDEATDLFLLVRDVSRAVSRALAPDGLHVWAGTGTLAGQSMGHMHVQVVPRFSGRPYTFVASEHLALTPLEERRRQAAAISAHIGEGSSMTQREAARE